MEQTNNQSLSGMTVQEAKDAVAKKHGKISWAILYKYYWGICSNEGITLRERIESEEQFFAIENEAILLYHSSHQQVKSELPTDEKITNYLFESGYKIEEVKAIGTFVLWLRSQISIPTQSGLNTITACVVCDKIKEVHEMCMDCIKKMIEENSLNKEEIIKAIDGRKVEIKNKSDLFYNSGLESAKDIIISIPSTQSKGEGEYDWGICLRDGCNEKCQPQYRLCPAHLREAHAQGFDDSNK